MRFLCGSKSHENVVQAETPPISTTNIVPSLVQFLENSNPLVSRIQLLGNSEAREGTWRMRVA